MEEVELRLSNKEFFVQKRNLTNYYKVFSQVRLIHIFLNNSFCVEWK